MKLTTKELTACALLTAMALGLSYLENFFPLALAVPIPGVKLGLANIVTVFALYALGTGEAFLILFARCLLGSMFAGNMNALIFSLLGGVTAMAVMAALSRLRGLSVYGVSAGGAAVQPTKRTAARAAPRIFFMLLMFTAILSLLCTNIQKTVVGNGFPW